MRQVRDAVAALLDQKTPFGRLALTHVVLTAGDALLTVSLAGSIFFKVTTSEARSNVILYLLLTMAPFAVVAPLLGPIIDRSRGARRATVVASTICRAGVSLFLADHLQGPLLYPLAFIMLVLSKVYLVTKGSLVPLVVAASERPGGDELATANARLGLLASLTSLAASIPAIGVYELLGGAWVLRLDMVVFAVGTVVALRLPVARTRGRRAREEHLEPDAVPVVADTTDAWDEETPIGALGPRANTHPEVLLALSSMSILRGLVGFFTFLLAFSLHRNGNAPGWYGFMLVSSVAGALIGVLIVHARAQGPERAGHAGTVHVVGGSDRCPRGRRGRHRHPGAAGSRHRHGRARRASRRSTRWCSAMCRPRRRVGPSPASRRACSWCGCSARSFLSS